MTPLEQIKVYVSSAARNKIVFCFGDICGLSFIDIGYEIASQISQMGKVDILKFFTKSYSDNDIGDYLAIENISILFEPELKIDIRSVIESNSINKCLIIKCDGVMENGIYHPFPENKNYNINLKGLSFINTN